MQSQLVTDKGIAQHSLLHSYNMMEEAAWIGLKMGTCRNLLLLLLVPDNKAFGIRDEREVFKANGLKTTALETREITPMHAFACACSSFGG